MHRNFLTYRCKAKKQVFCFIDRYLHPNMFQLTRADLSLAPCMFMELCAMPAWSPLESLCWSLAALILPYVECVRFARSKGENSGCCCILDMPSAQLFALLVFMQRIYKPSIFTAICSLCWLLSCLEDSVVNDAANITQDTTTMTTETGTPNPNPTTFRKKAWLVKEGANAPPHPQSHQSKQNIQQK